MKDMLSGGANGLRNIVNTVNVLEAGDQPGAKAMVSFYSKILVDELHYDPYKTHIFPAELRQLGVCPAGLLRQRRQRSRLPVQQRRPPGLHRRRWLYPHPGPGQCGVAGQYRPERRPVLERQLL